MNLLFRSHDAGLTWEGPEETGITEGIVPSIKELSNGDLLLGVTEQFRGNDPGRGFSEAQTVYRSSDQGKSWEGPVTVPNGFRGHCEGNGNSCLKITSVETTVASSSCAEAPAAPLDNQSRTVWEPPL